jgi:hypothetical protein
MEVAKPETQTSPWSQFPGSPSGTARHDDIYFIDENTGWSVRATGSSFYLQGIGFVGPDEGWIGGTAGIPYPSIFFTRWMVATRGQRVVTTI